MPSFPGVKRLGKREKAGKEEHQREEMGMGHKGQRRFETRHFSLEGEETRHPKEILGVSSLAPALFSCMQVPGHFEFNKKTSTSKIKAMKKKTLKNKNMD